MKRRIWCVALAAGLTLSVTPAESSADRAVGARSASAQVRFVIVIPRLLTVTKSADGRIVARSNDGPLILSSRRRTRVGMAKTSALAFARSQGSSRDWVIAAP